ncbi:general secretion pathway protein GspB [Vibrio algicola]|uniref:Type II secretion system protein GspB C-terminal domain-containing protein n=1 Tax=Vibrio algicola TaxID=2662262 RepID=A0A5Q0TFN7_9VIBR|nr:general secretion pathway protein GspB [Vibrio algicola]
MSQMMKALQQSEQAHQSQLQPKPDVASYRYVPVQKTARKWLMVALFVLPCLVVLAWLLIKPLITPKPIEKALPTAMVQSKPTAELLPFPSVGDLRPLPAKKIKPKPAVRKVTTVASKPKESKSQGRVIKTNQVNASSEQNQAWNVDDIDMSGVSSDIAERFKQAMEAQEVSDDTPTSISEKSTTQTYKNPKSYASKPQPNPTFDKPMVNLVGNEKRYKGRLPKMNFQTHMYSSKSSSRWLKVNGKDMHEGDWIIDDTVQLEKILPGSLVVHFDGQNIQIPALYEWGG